MHKIKFNLRNYKLIKEMDIVLGDEGNLYLVKGPNETGKTSLLQAIISLMTIKNDVPQPLSKGEAQGSIDGTIPGPDGDYIVKMDFSATSTTFQMYSPKGVKITRIADMRGIFEYNSMTVEDYIRKSYNTEGRREQLRILSSLLEPIARSRFELLLADVDTRKGKLFIKRKEDKAKLDDTQNLLNSIEVSDEDFETLKNSNQASDFLERLRIDKSTLEKMPDPKEEEKILTERKDSEIDLLNRQNSNREDRTNYITEEVKRLEDLIIKLNQEKELLDVECKEVNDKIDKINQEFLTNVSNTRKREDKSEELADINEQILELEEKEKELIGIRINVENKEKYQNRFDHANVEYLASENKLVNARNELKTIIQDIKVPGYNLEVIDDVIHIDGYPLNEHQQADSKLIIAVSAILAKVNHKSPILVVGKLAELDKSSLSKLEDIATENNCLIIGDYVTDNITEMIVEGHVDETKKDLPKDMIKNIEQSEAKSNNNNKSIGEI